MRSPFQKHKALILMLFLGGFISIVDSFIMNGTFKGVEEYKHFIYIGALLIGLGIVLSLLLKEDTTKE